MKVLINVLIILFTVNTLFSQEVGKCGLSQVLRKKQETDRIAAEKIENTKFRLAQLAIQKNTNSTVYIIPVVFHILHQGGPENISNDQVLDAMKQMNNDFRKHNGDTIQTVPEFQSIAADCEIEFRLATIDPDGNCTNGIIRHNTPVTNFDGSYPYSGVGPGLWDPQKYLNIYSCKALDFAGAAAYTYIPGWLGAGSSADAIVSLSTYVGSIGTASASAAHVLSHEVGHWLGLSHVWGDTNDPGVACGDDGVADTPITKGWQSCNLSSNRVCNPAIVENVQNFMEYSYCETMFTEGQKQLMRNVILTGANAGRDQLVSAPNLLATGVTSPQVCAPIADFKTNNGYTNYCVGQNVQFKDNTLNAPVTAWNWNFPGATPNTSTDSMPVVTYATPGVYPVSYTATNITASSSITKTNYISIVANVADNQSTFTENFETITVPNAQWKIANSNDANTWVQNTTVGCSGTNSLMINNFSNTPADIEILYTPSYNLAAINATSSPLIFTFKMAYQQKNATANERLQVLASVNCGQTWSIKYSKASSFLSTVSGTNTNAFVPSGISDWRTESVGISSLLTSQNVLFKFVFTSDVAGNANNIYIDDINIVQNSIGVNEYLPELKNDITVVPNPSNGQNTMVAFSVPQPSDVKFEVVDVLGKTIEESMFKSMQPGEQQVQLLKNSTINSGIYFLKITIGTKQVVKRIVIE